MKKSPKQDHIKKAKDTVIVPKGKERKKMPPPTVKHKKKKGKGSFSRKAKKKEEVTNEGIEKAQIIGFINSVIEGNPAQANKYLLGIVDGKISNRIQQNLNGPLFNA